MKRTESIEPSEMAEELVKVVMLERNTRLAELNHAISLQQTLLLAIDGMSHLETLQHEDLDAIRTTLNDLLLWQKKLLDRHNTMIEKSFAYVKGEEDSETLH